MPIVQAGQGFISFRIDGGWECYTLNMAYDKTDWRPRIATGKNRFLKSQETPLEVYLDNAPLSVDDPGTPFSAENMNNIEDGIELAHILIEEETQARTADVERLEADDADILQAAKEYTNEAQLATQTWLRAKSSVAELPTVGLNKNINYLCRVINDPVAANNGVYQAIAGWDESPEWTYFSDNADWIDEIELADAVGEHNTDPEAHPEILTALGDEARERTLEDRRLQEQIDSLLPEGLDNLPNILAEKAPLESPEFIGIPKVPNKTTAATNDGTLIATEAQVKQVADDLNVQLNAEEGTGTNITTPAVALNPIAAILQIFWNKIRQVANFAVSAVRYREFRTPGTYSFTLPSNVNRIRVTACGGGGGGGYGGNAGSAYGGGGGGGGSGGAFVFQTVYEVDPGATITVTVGRGGYPASNGSSTVISDESNNGVTLQGGKCGGNGQAGTACSGTAGAGGASAGPGSVSGSNGTNGSNYNTPGSGGNEGNSLNAQPLTTQYGIGTSFQNFGKGGKGGNGGGGPSGSSGTPGASGSDGYAFIEW